MLHAAVLERWKQHKTELVKRVRDLCIILKPFHCAVMEAEDFIGVILDITGARFAVKHLHLYAVNLLLNKVKFACGESKQICAYRFRLAEAKSDPAIRCIR